MKDLTINELAKIKQEAERKIAEAVSKIFEDFKEETDLYHTDQSIHIDMVYSQEVGQRAPEAIVSGASIRMTVL